MKNLIEAFIIFVVTLAFYILGFYAGERNITRISEPTRNIRTL